MEYGFAFWVLFFHICGVIIGLGAVSVIDTLGFVSRKNIKLTQVTIFAHHVTKPLIWIGMVIVFLTFLIMVFFEGLTHLNLAKLILLVILILNGSFLSFYVSPRLDAHIGKKALLPKKLQTKIIISMLISFICWWSFVFLLVFSL